MPDLIFPPLPDGALDEEYIQNYACLVLEVNGYEWKRWQSRDRILRAERDTAIARFERAVEILMGIHNLLYPPLVEKDGKVYQFRMPGQDVHEVMQTLSDRIRAIPQELDAARAE